MPSLQQTFARLSTVDGALTLQSANTLLRENHVQLTPLLPTNRLDHTDDISALTTLALHYLLSLLSDGEYDKATEFVTLWSENAFDDIASAFPDAPPALFETVYILE